MNVNGSNVWAGDYATNKGTQTNVNNAVAGYLGINNHPTPQPKPPSLAQTITQGGQALQNTINQAHGNSNNGNSGGNNNSNTNNISLYPPGSTIPITLNPSTPEGMQLMQNIMALGGSFNPAISLSGMGDYASQMTAGQLNPYQQQFYGGYPGMGMYGGYGGYGGGFGLNPYMSGGYGNMGGFGGGMGFNPYMNFGMMGGMNPYMGYGSQFGNSFGGYFQ